MIPVKLILENFISHIKSELDFTKFDAALLIGSHSGNPYVSNGVGKSSILDAIRWSISNKSRFSTKEKVVKRGKLFCRVTFEFEVDGEKYKIIRRLNKKSNLTDVQFYKKMGNKWEAEGYTCDTSTATNRKITEVIKMSDDTFINSIYFKQNDISGFASAPTAKRKEILKEVLQIGIWDEYQQIAKDKIKDFEIQYNSLEDRIKAIGDLDSKKKENEIKAKEVELQFKETKDDLKEIEKEFEKQRTIVSDLETALAQKGILNISKLKEEKKKISLKAKEIKQKHNNLQEQIEINKKTIKNTEKEYNDLKETLYDLSQIILKVSDLSGEKVSKIRNDFEQPEIQISQYNLIVKKEKLAEYKNNFASLIQDLSNLNAVKVGKECPTCLSKIDNLEDVIEKRRSRKKLIKFNIKEKEEIINELENIINEEEEIINKAKDAIIKFERIELGLERKEAIKSDAVHRNEIIQLELQSLNISWESLKEEHNKINSLLKIKENEDINNKLNDAKIKLNEFVKEINKIKNELIELSIQNGILKGLKEELERRSSEKNILSNQIDKIVKEMDVYKNLSKAFGKDGIQSIIIENVTEDLRKYTNLILKQICNDPMTIDFVTQRQTGTGSWKEQFDIKILVGNNDLEFDDLSGGEQIRISIALRLALSQLLTRRVGSNVKFLLLDEVDQALDRQGIDALASAILVLSKKLKILVITHNEAMKEKFENIITIQKGVSGSILKQ